MLQCVDQHFLFLIVNSALGTNYVLACSSWRAPGSLSQCHLSLSSVADRIELLFIIQCTKREAVSRCRFRCLVPAGSSNGQQQHHSVSVSNWNWWRNRFAADSPPPLKSTTLVSLLGNGMEWEGGGGGGQTNREAVNFNLAIH